MAIKKKVAPKKAATKKAPAKKAAAPKQAAVVKKIATIKEPMTKTALYTAIAADSGIAKSDVAKVFDALTDVINGHIKKNATGTFTLPGLMKVKTIRKPAQKARKNVPNPFKPGELMDVAAKPARTVVKVLPLKKMKDMVV